MPIPMSVQSGKRAQSRGRDADDAIVDNTRIIRRHNSRGSLFNELSRDCIINRQIAHHESRRGS